MADDDVDYGKSTTQRDLEARQAEDYVSPLVIGKTVGPNRTLISDDGFIGVSPEYANYANETDAPLFADEGPEKVIEDRTFSTAEEENAAEEARPEAEAAAAESSTTTQPASQPAPAPAPAPAPKNNNE